MRVFTILILCVSLTGCATPYASVNLETSDRPPMSAPVRTEIGITKGPLDVYGYHRSDAVNGFDHVPYEAENGIGARLRWEFD